MNATIASPSLPDVNVENRPYPIVQHLLDQTADMCLYAVPDVVASDLTLTPGNPDDYFGINGGYGISFESVLHGFDANVRQEQCGLRAQQAVGPPVGRLRGVCLFGPETMSWQPGKQPSATIYDPWRSQCFALTNATFQFGERDHCVGYGIGRTYPITAEGRPRVLAGAVGNCVMNGGRFAGLEATFVMTGFLTFRLGFIGNITLRLVDPQEHVSRSGEVRALSPAIRTTAGSTFFVLRGEKEDRFVRTTYGPRRGEEFSLVTPSNMRALEFSCVREGSRGVQTARRFGPVVANMEATVYFNLLAPPGTPARPVPFSTEEVYVFLDKSGRRVGTISAQVRDGASFGLKFLDAPDQPGVRFGGFGPVTGGTGQFEGASGMLTVNSLIGISPHALSLIHVLHLIDPTGRHRRSDRLGERYP